MTGAELIAKKLDELPERIRDVLVTAFAGRRRSSGRGRGAERELLEKREVARRLGCKVETIYGLISSGQLEVVQAGAREKIRTRDVERLVEEGWHVPDKRASTPPKKVQRRVIRKRVPAEPASSADELVREIAKIKL